MSERLLKKVVYIVLLGAMSAISAVGQESKKIAISPSDSVLPSLKAYPYMPYIFRQSQPQHADDKRMFQGIPAIAITPGGRLWAAWYGGGVDEGPENFVMLVTSGDGGKTWSNFQMVIDPSFRCSEPGLWVDPGGRLWFLFGLFPYDLHRPGAQLWAMTTDNPDAPNPAWSAPRLICMEQFCINKPSVITDGTWLWPSASAQFPQEALKPPSAPLGLMSRPLISRDQGKTFQLGGEIPIEQAKRNYEEYKIIEKKDGTLWLLTRTNYGIGESFSTDAGMSWSDVVPSSIMHTPARFFITRLRSGNLLLVKNGNIGENVGRSRLTAMLSTDDGKTWSEGLTLDERGQVSYPDGAQAADGFIYLIYDRGRYTEKEILLAKFTEEDVSAKKIVSPGSQLKMLVNKATGQNPIATDMKTVHPLQTGVGAEFVPGNFTIEPLEKGSKIFTDRDVVWQDFPKELRGASFLHRSIDGGPLTVAREGLIYVATHRPSMAARYSLQQKLVELGFLLTPLPEFTPSGAPQGSVVLWQKKAAPGDVLDLGKLGIVIIPRQ